MARNVSVTFEPEIPDPESGGEHYAVPQATIVVGKQLGARLPDRVIKDGAAVAFLVFGAVLLVEGVRG